MSWKPFDYFGEEMDEIKIKSVLAKYIYFITAIFLQFFPRFSENANRNKKIFVKINN